MPCAPQPPGGHGPAWRGAWHPGEVPAPGARGLPLGPEAARERAAGVMAQASPGLPPPSAPRRRPAWRAGAIYRVLGGSAARPPAGRAEKAQGPARARPRPRKSRGARRAGRTPWAARARLYAPVAGAALPCVPRRRPALRPRRRAAVRAEPRGGGGAGSRAAQDRAGTITFFEELRVDHENEEAAERGPRERPERLQELHRGEPWADAPEAASAPRRAQPPRPPARAPHPPPARAPRNWRRHSGRRSASSRAGGGEGRGEERRGGGEGAGAGAGGGGEVSRKSPAAAAAAQAARPPSRAAGRRGPGRGGAAAAAP